MSGGTAAPRVFTIPPGVPFLPALAEALCDGRLVPGFTVDDDPLALAGATIYVPTRRAARELRGVFMERAGGRAAILPTVRPLGEFDEDGALFLPGSEALADLAPPIGSLDRLLLLAPLVRLWKQRLPAHVVRFFEEEIVVPASAADSIWLARDLAALVDEVETEGAGWQRLESLAGGELAGWWQVTLNFLKIVTDNWPAILAERQRSDPAAHRNALIRAEARRLAAFPPAGPVIAAGSTGSIPATADLLAVIAGLPSGAVVLPGLDRTMDTRTLAVLGHPAAEPAVLGHPQYGMLKLLRRMGCAVSDVAQLAEPDAPLALRATLAGEAFRPADTTDEWASRRAVFAPSDVPEALAGVVLVEAANERDEAMAIALALRQAVEAEGSTAALVTGDRQLARRVSADLLRFGIRADDSGGSPLSGTVPGSLLLTLVDAAMRPGDPVPILALLKHPLLRLGRDRGTVIRAAGVAELIALRGGVGRPDIAALPALFERRLTVIAGNSRPAFWWKRLSEADILGAGALLEALSSAVAPLVALRGQKDAQLAELARASVLALEVLARDTEGGVDALYAGDAGDALASFLRGLVAGQAPFSLDAPEWPDVLEALIAPEAVKPSQGSDPRVSIWGALEARLLSPDTLVVGGLNEGVWPAKASADRFMSRIMKSEMQLEPPERRIGQAAHDFQMALGVRSLVLTRSARAGDAPAVASRWLQRLRTFAGADATAQMRARGDELLALARSIDSGQDSEPARQPCPTPPLEVRPRRFSVTEIETLRRDPYAVYARRILGLSPLDPLLRDPGPAERGTLFHDILHRFAMTGIDASAPEALDALVEAGRACFAETELPDDVAAVWWPRFEQLAEGIIDWERSRDGVLQHVSEARAGATDIGETGATLSGYADRIDVRPSGVADILDYKTGSSPSKTQAHRLVSPQLPLEAAMLSRGAFGDVGRLEAVDLVYVRLKPDGSVVPESILSIKGSDRSAGELAAEAWERLETLVAHYGKRQNGYLSRALPLREGDTDGDYDHLARVLEWSAGEREGGDA